MNEEKKITHSFYLGTHLYVICMSFVHILGANGNPGPMTVISRQFQKEIPLPSIGKMSLKIINVKFHPNLPGSLTVREQMN